MEGTIARKGDAAPPPWVLNAAPVMNSSGSGSELLSEGLDFFFSRRPSAAASRSISGQLRLGSVPERRTETIRVSEWDCEGDAARGLRFGRWTFGRCNQKFFCPFCGPVLPVRNRIPPSIYSSSITACRALMVELNPIPPFLEHHRAEI